MMRSTLASLGLNLTINGPRHTPLPLHQTSKARDSNEWEKREDEYQDYSEQDDSSCPSSPHTNSTRSTFDSHPSNRPMIRRRNNTREKPYGIRARIGRNLVVILILAIVGCITFLIYMGQTSSKSLESYRERRKSRPKDWESYEFLTRYYGGIRTVIPAANNTPEYPHKEITNLVSNETNTKPESLSTDVPIHKVSESIPWNPYPDYNSAAYLDKFEAVTECFLDAKSSIKIPLVQVYKGRPNGFPDNVLGSYEVLGIQSDICLERFGRYGPYGHGYGVRLGGLGTGLTGDSEGSQTVWEKIVQAEYKNIDWAAIQGRCYDRNSKRYGTPSPYSQLSIDLDAHTKDNNNTPRDEGHPGKTSQNITTESKPKVKLGRTAAVIRTWDNFEYSAESIMWLRSVISELSLGSGGEYDVHLLVHVKNESVPIFADEEAYIGHLHRSVPEEFWGIATMWTETQMQMLYKQLLHLDTHPRGDDLHVHGAYRGLTQALQYFAHNHPEYDFFWQLEMDIRFTGHLYDHLSKFTSWAKKQPRKGLWERNGRYYIPSIHGSWEDFVQMVRIQTESGGASPNDMFSGLKGFTGSSKPSTAETPIWGPQRPLSENDWFETDSDPLPPTSHAEDKYAWGVNEEADLITLNPLFDPEGTEWGLKDDVTGYNATLGAPPRRAAIITASRMSRRLLRTMHRESAFKHHHAFPEMWPATTALHHGYKAVYVPHPIFVDRDWPLPLLAGTMNAGRNGASGGARTSVFGEEREHNTRGLTFYYNAGFAGNLYRRWMGLKVDNEGGEGFELEGRGGLEGKRGVPAMRGGEGRMCLPMMVLHPVKGVELPVESVHLVEFEVVETDPSA